MTATPPQRILDLWFSGRSIVGIEQVGGGLSGASVWKVTTESLGEVVSWALKCWPDGSRAERVAEIHWVLGTARRNACPAIPAALLTGNPANSWLNSNGKFWECSAWTDGGPPDLNFQLEPVITEMARWIGMFANSVHQLGGSRSVPMTILDRWRRMEGLRSSLPNPLVIGAAGFVHGYNEEQRKSLSRALQVISWAWPKTAPEIMTGLAHWTETKLDLQYVVRDVHFGNTLFSGGKLVAFVDFDAVRMDTPAADLSRLVGSVLLERAGDVDASAVWEAVLAAYRTVRTLSTEEETLARWLSEVNPLINLANWVAWLGVEGRNFGESQGMAFQRLEQWSRVVASQSGVTLSASDW